MAGAVAVGTCLGGPVGLLVSLKLGAIAALGGSIMGYCSAKIIEEHKEREAVHTVIEEYYAGERRPSDRVARGTRNAERGTGGGGAARGPKVTRNGSAKRSPAARQEYRRQERVRTMADPPRPLRRASSISPSRPSLKRASSIRRNSRGPETAGEWRTNSLPDVLEEGGRARPVRRQLTADMLEEDQGQRRARTIRRQLTVEDRHGHREQGYYYY